MIKSTTSMLALRSSLILTVSPLTGALLRSRSYSTQTGLGASASSTARRRKVTAFNDDGFVPWSELSAGEKASRATQQSFNFGLVLVGIALTVSPPLCNTSPISWLLVLFLTLISRAVSATSSGTMSSLPTARLHSSTELSVRSRTTKGVWSFSVIPKRSQHTVTRPPIRGAVRALSRKEPICGLSMYVGPELLTSSTVGLLNGQIQTAPTICLCTSMYDYPMKTARNITNLVF